MKWCVCLIAWLCLPFNQPEWGFFGHKKINNHAVFLLPPGMMGFFKSHLDFLTEHAADPDKRRYMVPQEAPRHYIDLDRYGHYPFDSLPRRWIAAVARYGIDSLNRHGIVPWWVQVMLARLTDAMRENDPRKILKLAADLGHYIADAHVPLHTSSNHNGQFTDQKGIHGFWESRVPELLADKEWDFFIGRAEYISNPGDFIWKAVLESAAATDSVLSFEKILSGKFSPDHKYAFEERNGILVRQYSSAFTRAYDRALKGMIERRMRQAIHAVASFWYTAWINAGQPDLHFTSDTIFTKEDEKEFEVLAKEWREN